MKANNIRSSFVDFFESNKKVPHTRVASSQLIPASDTSVLFTIAGMQQFKPYFLGKGNAKKDFGSNQLVSIQKCFRVADIDDIGDESHLTFFEMLGNFSIGGYFKEDAIALAWEFVTKKMRIPKERLLVTYFSGDKESSLPKDYEAQKLWEKIGVDSARIIPTGKEETFWGPPGETGPCGPSTEIHYIKDLQKENVFEQGNTLEIWNIVFMQYEKTKSGEFLELKQKNIDTGMGLERLALVVEHADTIFETSLFKPLIDQISHDPAFDSEAGNVYARLRIIADHLRASIFLLTDGVSFGKKEQQAVLRRIFRKALDQYRGLHANIKGLLDVVAETYEDAYPEIQKRKREILSSMIEEQQLYHAVRDRKVEGFLQRLRKHTIVQSQQENLQGPSHRLLTAAEAFQLNTTHGFSFDQLRSEGYTFDEDEVQNMILEHKAKSKVGSEKKFGGHGLDTIHQHDVPEKERTAITRLHTATHLLHSALRKTLGDDVQQQGSDITAERLRFDFAFPRKLTEEEKSKITSLVNSAISSGYTVIRDEMPFKEALAKGALAFFREKYPETVSVYSVVDPSTETVFSMELCGGPHVKNTKELGRFSIISEKSVAKGIRRIKAELS